MGGGLAIGISALAAGINALQGVRRNRYIESERNRLLTEKNINELNLAEDLSAEHAQYYNQQIETLQKEIVTLAEDKGRAWYKQGLFTSQDRSDINTKVQKLAREIQLVKANDADIAKQEQFAKAHQDEIDPDYYAEQMAIGISSGGKIKVNAIRPKATDTMKYVADATTEAEQANAYSVTQEGGYEVKRVDPKFSVLKYGKLASTDEGRRGITNDFLVANPEIISALPEIYQYAKQKGAGPKELAEFNQAASTAVRTGYKKAIIGNPWVQKYAVNEWGTKNIMPMIAPSSRKPIEKKEMTQAELDRVPFTVDGDIINIKTPEKIIDKDGNELIIEGVNKKTGRVFGQINVPEHEEQKPIPNKPGYFETVKKSASKGNLDIPIADVSDQLYQRVPWLGNLVPQGNIIKQPPAPAQQPGQAWKNYREDELKQTTYILQGGIEATYQELKQRGWSDAGIAKLQKK